MPTIPQLEKLIAADPGDPFGHYALGQERAKGGDHGGAIACYDTALELDAQYCYAYYFKAQSMRALGMSREALLVIAAGIAAARKSGNSKALGELSTLEQTMQ